MKRAVALAMVAGLCGCTMWSSTMRYDVVDYTDVLETTGNQLLLVNVLQARDGVPLHFAAIPNIHGSLAGSVSVAATDSFPLGTEGHVINGKGPGKTGTPGAAFLNGAANPTLSVSDSPSFEVDSVETKDFVTGISSPIDAKFVKYWVDRGVDKRIILLMFFSSAKITEKIYDHDKTGNYIWFKKTDAHPSAPCSRKKQRKHLCQAPPADTASVTGDEDKKPIPCPAALVGEDREKKCTRKVLGTQSITIFNSPRAAANELRQCWSDEHHPRSYYLMRDVNGALPKTDCRARTQFENYLTLIDTIRSGITANSYSERDTLSAPLEIKAEQQLKDIGKLDPKKYALEFRLDGKYVLYSSSDDAKVALCFNESFATGDAKEGCTQSVITNDPVDPDDGGTTNYPVDPIVTLSSSGDCGSAHAFAETDPHAAAPYVGPLTDLNYCTILKRFECYTGTGLDNEPKGPYAARDAKKAGIVDQDPTSERDCKKWPKGTFSLKLNGRSVAEMVRFLGDLLYYQDVMQGPDLHHNIPLTVDWDTTKLHPNEDREKGLGGGRGDCAPLDGGCLFQVKGCLFPVAPQAEGDPIVEEDRIHVTYRDNPYAIGGYRARDHSLEVLSMLNQLINLNKSAADLRTTPTVQLVP